MSDPPTRTATTSEAAAPRGGLSVRSRVVAAVIAVLAALLATLTATDVVVQRQQVIDRIDAALDRRWHEVIRLTETGVDPATGSPFTTAEQLVFVILQRSVPSPNEGELGIVGGRVEWTAQEEVTTRLERDDAFVAHILPLAQGAAVTSGSVTTDDGRYRFIVIPITLSSAPDATAGAVVFAFDEGAELDLVTSSLWWRLPLALSVFAAGALIVWLVMGRLLRPIAWLRETAQEISDTDLTRRIPVRGNDDLAELTVTVNTMLDRLERAVSSQRELLDDVGHELRTPLTVIRGHLELMDAADPVDARATRELVVDEVDRMNRLVSDLTLLAASDRTDFVRLELVHVGLLVDEALEKARLIGDRRWRLGAFLDLEAHLDPQRITQALLQLAANAVKYSEPGTSVTFEAALDGASIRMSVCDEGRGIPADRFDEVFGRFTRVRETGDRIEGAGLGLAIVRGIAHAHGGTVELDSEPGAGSTFTIIVPLRSPEVTATSGVPSDASKPEATPHEPAADDEPAPNDQPPTTAEPREAP